MKTKILLAVTAMLTIALCAKAEERSHDSGASGKGYGSQQIVVNNYYYGNGYEYSSRLKRFHNSYTSFDFYSPVYTEAYWYNFTPYTWGVSIYDDWYYYGAGVSRYSWRSGFGGSYWWGYDPWMDYDPWMGYGWNSWYSPGFSNGINIYLGRPQYHYPVAWNRWNYHQHWNSYRPVYIVNNNRYNTYVNSNNYGRNYNPSRTTTTDRRSGYTVVSGRSTQGTSTGTTRSEGSGIGTTRSAGTGTTGTGRTQGTRVSTGTSGTGRTQGTRAGTGTTESRGNSAGQGNSDKEKSNNGLRVGQNRRGVAVPAEARPNEPARPNNPNVNDRTDPGKEKTGTRTQTQTEMRAPVPAQSRQQTQGTVRTTTRRNETTVSQGSPTSTTREGETTIKKSTEKRSTESAESKTSKTESGRRSTTSAKKR